LKGFSEAVLREILSPEKGKKSGFLLMDSEEVKSKCCSVFSEAISLAVSLHEEEITILFSLVKF
jgi:hypothetical protein